MEISKNHLFYMESVFGVRDNLRLIQNSLYRVVILCVFLGKLHNFQSLWERINITVTFKKCCNHRSAAIDIFKLYLFKQTFMYCNRLHAWWSTQSRLVTFLSSNDDDDGWSDFKLYDGPNLKAYLLMRW